jgi:hypothetical protein
MLNCTVGDVVFYSHGAVLFSRGCGIVPSWVLCILFHCGGCIAPPWVLFCSIVGAVLFSPRCITVQSWVHPYSRGCCMYCAIMGAVHCSLVDAHTAQSWVLSFSFAGVVFLLFSHGSCAVQCRVLYCMFHRMGIPSAIHL